MRKAILVVALIGASFAGGAAVNGPGLSWVRNLIAPEGERLESLDEADADAPEPDAVADPPAPRSKAAARTAGARARRTADDLADAATAGPATAAPAPLRGLVGAAAQAAAAATAPAPAPTETPAAAGGLSPPKLEAPGADPSARAAGARPDPVVTPAGIPADVVKAPAERAAASGPTANWIPPGLSRALSGGTPAPAPAPAPAPDAAKPAAPGSAPAADGWAEVRRRMTAHGVTRYWIEGDAAAGTVRFRCVVPLAGRAAVAQQFEGEGDDLVAAAEATLRRIDLWQATEQP